jgi:hypothetical protein
VKHKLYFWREEQPIELAADSLLVRHAEDRNLAGVVPLSLATIKSTFTRCFPGITGAEFGMEWRVSNGFFQVSFIFDDCNQPKVVCIGSEYSLVETPQIFDRIIVAARELGCTRIESTLE